MLPSLYMEEALHLVKFVTWFRLFTNLSHFQEGEEGGQKNSLHGSGLSNGSIARVQNSIQEINGEKRILNTSD